MTLQSTPGSHSPQPVDLTLDLSTYARNHSPNVPPSVFIPCDNPRNIASPFVSHMVDLVVYGGIFPVLVACGVTGNIINMAVFVRQGLSDRIHLCLFSLALSDTGFLLFLMCGKSFALISLVDPVAGNYWLQHHNGPVLGNYLGFLSISNTITALIAMERCLCIVSPFKAAKFFKTKYMRVGIVVLAVFVLVVMNVSLNLKYQTVQITDPITNTSTFIARLGPVYLRHSVLIEALYGHLLSVFIPTTSFIVVIICTLTIIFHLRRTADWRRKTVSNLTSVEKQEVTVTRMLVTVCSVYVICMVPNVARTLVLLSHVPGFLVTGHLCNAFKMTIALTHMLEAFNATVNFFIYIKQSSRYRATLSQLCCCTVEQ